MAFFAAICSALSCRCAHVQRQIYSALSALSEHEAEVLAAVLPGAACIWVGSGFVPAARVAFRCTFLLSLFCFMTNSPATAYTLTAREHVCEFHCAHFLHDCRWRRFGMRLANHGPAGALLHHAAGQGTD